MRMYKLRNAKKMTQSELAKLCQTTQQQIAKIESGAVDPKLSTLRRIASALGCELADQFFTKKSFLREINDAVKRNKINLSKVSVMYLYGVCVGEKGCNHTIHSGRWSKLETKKFTSKGEQIGVERSLKPAIWAFKKGKNFSKKKTLKNKLR